MSDIWFRIMVLAVFAAFFAGLFAGSGLERSGWRHAATERSYGQWCPTTGLWAWEGECEG